MRLEFGKGDELITFMSSVRPARVPKRRPAFREAPGEGIGVFLCRCGGAVSGRIDVESLCRLAAGLPDVVVSEVLDFPCSREGREQIKHAVRESQLKGFVVAGCSPKTHERLFMTTAMEAGLNPMMFEIANLREQCAFVHRPPASTQKAGFLLRAAVAKCIILSPAPFERRGPFSRRVLVVGDGETAMVAASSVIDQGAEVVLVSSDPTWQGAEGSGERLRVPERLRSSESARVLDRARVTSFGGSPGAFFALVETEHSLEEISCGAVILALQARELPIEESGQFVTQSDFERMLDDGKVPDRTVMILSGSSECGRACSLRAIGNALTLKRMRGEAEITIIGRDFVSPGLCELDYRAASLAGVRFIRSERRPEVSGKTVSVRDMYTGDVIEISADVVVIDSVYRVGRTDELASLFEVPIDENSFFRRTHVKLKPSATLREGVFLCGSAAGPRLPSEEVLEAEVAASRAVALLSHEVETGGAVAEVDPEKCSACLTCVRSCPFTAPFIGDSGKAEIEICRCQGCGICVGICPSKAIEMHCYSDSQIDAQIGALLEVIR